jgi:hypothetical protein
MGEDDYGLLLEKETAPASGTYAIVGNVIKSGIPGFKAGSVETTHHSSAGKRAYKGDGLLGLKPFTSVIEFTAAALAAVYADAAAGTTANYRIIFSDTLLPMFDFAAFPTDIDPSEADAQSPKELVFSVTWQPTGTADFTPSVAAGDWYDNVTALYFTCGGALAITSSEEHQLVVYAIKGGAVYGPLSASELADLTFASSVAGDATVSAGGLIEGVSSGETVVSATLAETTPDCVASVVVTLAS